MALSLPRFDFPTPTFSLKSALVAMGMSTAFTASADFSGIASQGPCAGLSISDVLQKATVAVQENGVEAAAATAVVFGTTGSGGGPTPVPMVVNRPFVISIVDVPTGAVLFLGHIGNPTDAGSQ